ncbi:LysM peptidoglycan-binding domain-containing protein, partial [Streptomyces chiangmaiensis]
MFALACTAVLSTVQSASAAPAKAAAGTTHTVQGGDTLYRIARSEKVPGGWQALASANKISSPFTLVPGQVLSLPSDTSSSAPTRASSSTYTVHPGDTLYRIARKYQVPGGWQALAEANDIYRPERLAIGRVLDLPAGSSSPAGASTTTKAATP